MPFTFCHPAIVLPLKYSRYFSLTALITGSMMPDFEYFIRMQILGKYGHTLGGIFYFNLPLGFLCTFIFHQLIRNSLINNLPLFFKSRLYIFTSFNWIQYWKNHKLVVLFSLLLGILSHLFWDSFTHYNGYFVTKISWLQSEIHYMDFHIPVYNFLQHLSSVAGGLIIFWVIGKLPPDYRVSSGPDIRYWIIWGISALIITCFRFVWEPEKLMFANLVVTLIGAGLWALLISGYCYKRYFFVNK